MLSTQKRHERDPHLDSLADPTLLREFAYINGEWCSGENDARTDVYNPANGVWLGSVASMSAEQSRNAVHLANAAFEAWSRKLPQERGKILDRWYDLMMEAKEDLAILMTAEQGKPLAESRGEVNYGASFLKWFSEEGKRVYGDIIPQTPDRRGLVIKQPIGVVAAVTPWNFPNAMITRKIAPALAAGCTVVLKPSEIAPQTAFILAEILDGTDLPKGVFNMVCGYGHTVGDTLIKHPDVRMVSFTGSTRTGNLIAHAAADDFKRFALEMGGKSASVILPDADLAAAVKGTINNCLLNSGQTCTALTRMLVPADKHDEACELAAAAVAKMTPGNPLEETTRLGPLSSAQQRDKVIDYIKLGIQEGAKLIAGGPEAPEGCEKGYFVKATVFGNVKPDSRIAQEEIFGPVLCVIPYNDEAEAVKIANGTQYGLSGAVWSGDDAKAKKIASKLRTGQVFVNGGAFNPMAPFGGFGHSGIGREFGKWGLEEFLEIRSLQL